MLYITQLVYIQEGAEDIFEQFESVAMPLIPRYGGKLLLRVRPSDDSFISGTLNKPYEIHVVSFENDQQLDDFMKDEERKTFLHLKERSIESVILIKGSRLGR